MQENRAFLHAAQGRNARVAALERQFGINLVSHDKKIVAARDIGDFSNSARLIVPPVGLVRES